MTGPLPRCPFCHSELHGDRVLAQALPPPVLLLAVRNSPWWRPGSGDDALCGGCAADLAEQLRGAEEAGFPPVSGGAAPILPTPIRLGSRERFRGRGVTIAFLDSGFYAHPDLVEPEDRILRYVDVTDPERGREELERPDESSWHGMMTSVVACGNGHLSGGLYRSLASEARVVLVKCGTARRITHADLERGLLWVVRNRKRYGIRICNVSCGGDYEASYLTDGLSRAAERATRHGVLVVAAAGNLGAAPGHPVLPPASAPSVLTVGGLDDKNTLANAGHEIYHGSYGPTVDGLQKPEVIAPAIWVAAPILPGTPTAAQARLYALLAASPDAALRSIVLDHAGVDGSLDAACDLEPPLLRQLVAARLRDNNVISGAYKHVDGTSFAAPIVSSIAAKVLEANPALSPREVKLLLLRNARRLPGVEVDRQGWGVVDAGRTIDEAMRLAAGRRG